jgi:hypothetical protein
MYISQYSNELLQTFDEFLQILANSYKLLQILTNSSHLILILFNSQVSSEHEDYLSTRMQARQANKRLWYRENLRGSGYEILQSSAYGHC